MPRVILTTCGTSLFTSNCWKKYDLSAEPALSKAAAENKPRLEKRYRDYTIGHKEADPTGQSLVKVFDEQIWDTLPQIAKLPAELASLKAITMYFEKRKQPLNSHDKIKLLHSDNSEGEYCALAIKLILELNIKLACSVSLDKQEGLDPQNYENFNAALERIWEGYFREIENSSDQYTFNLTGGYKGIAVILGGLAYKMQHAGVTIFYLHETSNYENIAVNGFRDGKLSGGLIELNSGEYTHQFGLNLFE